MQIILSIATIGLMVFVLVDIITTEEWRIRNLNKVIWVILVIFLPLVGSIIWFLAGRPSSNSSSAPAPAFLRSSSPQPSFEDDELRIEREIEFHENEARIRRLEAELKARRERSTD